VARNIRNMVCSLRKRQDRGPSLGQRARGTPGNERADSDALAGKAAGKAGYSRVMSIAHLKLRISEKFRSAKESWHKVLSHHGTEEIPPPPEEVLDSMRNALARAAAQIRTGHWRSAVYLRIRKLVDDKCWTISAGSTRARPA
jgi:hypothetical protein